jgi:hypothetical protein
MLVKQSAHFPKEGLIDVQRAGQGMRAGVSNKICMSDLDRHRAGLQRTLAQPSAHVFGKRDEGGFEESRIKDVFLKGVLPGDRFDLLPWCDGTYVFSPGPPGQCLSPPHSPKESSRVRTGTWARSPIVATPQSRSCLRRAGPTPGRRWTLRGARNCASIPQGTTVKPAGFLGSGSTMIAADRTSRVSCTLELDPHYCALALARCEGFTGKSAQKSAGSLSA